MNLLHDKEPEEQDKKPKEEPPQQARHKFGDFVVPPDCHIKGIGQINATEK